MKANYVYDTTINLFRPADHFRRFNKSAKRLAMPEVDESLFIGALEELIKLDYRWVPKKHGQALYLRPFMRSEEHTSELQSRGHLVCRLLLEKKKNRMHVS